MHTPECEHCDWLGNPTDEGAQSQIDEHVSRAHGVVVEVSDTEGVSASEGHVHD